jgi:hypothetical protein
VALSVSGATISIATNCEGTVGTTHCQTADAQATASLNYASSYTNSFSFNAAANVIDTNVRTSSSSSASFSDTYLFTIQSGVGGGTYTPCVSVSGDHGTASVTFGSFGLSAPFNGMSGTCGAGGNLPVFIPFTDGVTQTLLVQVSASGTKLANIGQQTNGAMAGLGTPWFFDQNGQRLNNVTFTLVSTSVPEPAFGILLALILGYQVIRIGYFAIRSSGVKIVQPCSNA